MTASSDQPSPQTDARVDLESELSRLSAFAHRRVPGPAAVVVAVRVGGRLHAGGHGLPVGRIIELSVEGSRGRSATTLVGGAAEDPGEQDDLLWSASPERLADLGLTSVATFPLRPALGPVVGSLSLFAASPALLPRPEDTTFDDVLRVLGVATSSVRQSAVARSNTELLRGGPAPTTGLGRRCPPA